jgi:pumilio family protein 6
VSKSLSEALKSTKKTQAKGARSHSKNGDPTQKFSKKREREVGESQKSTGDERNGRKKSRASQKPNFQLVEKLKNDWNKVRSKNILETERAEVVHKMVQQLDQHVLEVAMRHDASRAIQSIIQFGTVAQRTGVLESIQGKISEVI